MGSYVFAIGCRCLCLIVCACVCLHTFTLDCMVVDASCVVGCMYVSVLFSCVCMNLRVALFVCMWLYLCPCVNACLYVYLLVWICVVCVRL